MKRSLIKTAVRTRFLLTGRHRASHRIRALTSRYVSLSQALDHRDGRRCLRVPPMLGVDEDMRDWSFFMILEHNVIVNRSITDVVDGLGRGVRPDRAKAIDPKRDVMPSENPGPEQVAALEDSVAVHLQAVSRLPRLRNTITARHPLFDDLDAHGWHCMFMFHLEIHLRQAHAVVRIIEDDRSRGAR